MRNPLPPISAGQGVTNFQFGEALPYIRVDNPTRARVYFPDLQASVGPYTLGAVLPWKLNPGISTVDASDISYANIGIFSNALITMVLTDEEKGTNPGVCYAPVANITSTVPITGTISGSVTVSNTINATITNASIPVTQSGTWNVTISNATIAVTQSGTWNVSISNATIAVTQSGAWNVVITSGTINATITNATIAVTQSGAWSVSITNATINVAQSGIWSVAITNATLNIAGTANITIVAQTIQVGVQLPWTAVGTGQSGLGGFTTAVVPTGTQTLAISMDSGISITSLLIQGLTSGIVYERAGNSQISGGFMTVPVNPAVDTQYVLSWAGSGVSLVRAFASAAFMGYPALGQNPMGESVPVVIAGDQTAFPVTVQLGERIINFILSLSRAIGTYNFQVQSARTDFAGIAVYYKGAAGAGNSTIGIVPTSLTNFTSPGSVLTSGGVAAGQVSYLRMYPGLSNVASSSANDLCGLSPIIQLIITGANLTSYADVDLIP